jgi:phospholipid/cholesterol/gamma-HCH transport system substrate-binding protein
VVVKNKEFKVGLFIAVSLALLYFGFNYLKGIDFFSSTNKYYAVYDNIDQLAVSNPVLVNGFAVGRVSKRKLLQGNSNHVLVEFEIDSDIVLTDSTKAILNSELLGGKSVLLNIGKSNKVLKPGDTLIAEVAKGMFDVLSETATPVATDLQTTLRKFGSIVDELSENSKQLKVIFGKLEKTPDLLNKTLMTTNEKIEVLAGSYKTLGDNLNHTITELKPTLSNFKTVSDSLKAMKLNQTLLKAQQTLTSLNDALSKLKKHDNTMGRLMTEDSVYVNLNKLLVSLKQLTDHFDNNPKHFLGPLGKSKSKIERDRKKEQEEKEKQKAAAEKKP